MDVELAEFLRVDVQFFGACLCPRKRCLRRFFHHIAQLPSELQRAFAGSQQRFDKQNVATRGGPCKSGRYTDLILLENFIGINMRDAEELVEVVDSHTDE